MAVSIDAQAAINEIARDLDRGVDGYRASAAPDPVIGFSSPSTQFGDDEFLHEIGMYGISDPLLRAAMREFGASIATTRPQSGMHSQGIAGESITKHSDHPFSSTPYSAISKTEFDLPTIWPFESERPVKDREYLNDLWRHEYRHQGMDLARERQDRSLWRKGTDFLGRMYSSPLDYELQDIFNPGWDKYPSKFFGLTESRKTSDEEAFIRVLDMLYGKSKSYRPKALRFLKGTMAAQGLIDDPESWRDHFLEGDPNNYLNKFEAYLSGNP